MTAGKFDTKWVKNHVNQIKKLDNISSEVIPSEPLHLNNPSEIQSHQSLAYSLLLRSERRLSTILYYLKLFRYPVFAHFPTPNGIQ